MELSALVDALVPGPDTPFDQASKIAHGLVRAGAETSAGQPVWKALYGNTWNGHPLHPVVIVLPIGAWATSAWFDLRSVGTADPRDEHAADGALRFGIATSLVAAATGLAQYVDTRGQTRRETTVHAALNTAALTLYLGSWAARRAGRRTLGRRLAAVALTATGLGGYLGGDLSYRHGVGVRPQAFRDQERSAAGSSAKPLQASGSRHS